MDLTLVEKYAWDGRCPSIRAQVLANPSRFQELMPAQYAEMMHTVKQQRAQEASAAKWRAAAMEAMARQLKYRREQNGDRFRGGYTEPAKRDYSAEEKNIVAWEAAEIARIEAAYTQLAALPEDEKARERKQFAAEIARETLVQTSAANEIARLKAELAATKAELAMATPRKGYATPALAALLKK
jgi:hypothetical protein